MYKEYKVSMLANTHRVFNNLKRTPGQERLSLFYWKPSVGRYTFSAVILDEIPLPDDNELNLTGNVSYKMEYFLRVLKNIPSEYGVGLVHNHFSPGWQEMSEDDVILESKELARIICPLTNLPFLGLTMGIDGFVSGRFWTSKQGITEKIRVNKVKVVDEDFNIYYHPNDKSRISNKERKIASKSVWGDEYQSILEGLTIGIVGLGSVGSLVADGLSHVGVNKYILFDEDRIEYRNLDRTAGATVLDVLLKRKKVSIAKRNIRRSCTSKNTRILKICAFIQRGDVYEDLLDCDFIFCCVDKHYPRYLLNIISLSHLIPVVDGGILVELRKDKSVKNITWREHLVAPNRSCLGCLNAFSYDEVLQEIDGTDINPVYINIEGQDNNLGSENVYSFSMSLAANEINLFIGYVTSKRNILEYKKNRQYHGLSGFIFQDLYKTKCLNDCVWVKLTGKAIDIKDVIAK